VAGDLNVAVEDVDFYNPHEPRMASAAGTTPAERNSARRFAEAPISLVDAFRLLHPSASGQYTYWSQRARNRPVNRGLRLDYFLASPRLARAIVDVQHRQIMLGSDHCPVVLELDLDRLGLDYSTTSTVCVERNS